MLIQSTNIGNAPAAVHASSPAPAPVAPTKHVQAAETPATTPTNKELKSAVDAINKSLRSSNNSLEFSVDSDTKRPVVKLVDTETGETIRQIPSEKTLAISRDIDQFQMRNGTLLKQVV